MPRPTSTLRPTSSLRGSMSAALSVSSSSIRKPTARGESARAAAQKALAAKSRRGRMAPAWPTRPSCSPATALYGGWARGSRSRGRRQAVAAAPARRRRRTTRRGRRKKVAQRLEPRLRAHVGKLLGSLLAWSRPPIRRYGARHRLRDRRGAGGARALQGGAGREVARPGRPRSVRASTRAVRRDLSTFPSSGNRRRAPWRCSLRVEAGWGHANARRSAAFGSSGCTSIPVDPKLDKALIAPRFRAAVRERCAFISSSGLPI